jgi:hypothetical protein
MIGLENMGRYKLNPKVGKNKIGVMRHSNKNKRLIKTLLFISDNEFIK